MKIKELTIYGYGKFEHFSLKELGPLQVIYGPNEAGKSTILSFIHSVLFGFPPKQSNEPRYEPKYHSKYGGQLVMELDDQKLVRIERVKGKATGDVTVILEDGTTGGEDLLQQILHGMDKQLFQGIYSFNIHGLQNVHKLKGEDLNRFLFSTGALGTDQLMEAENFLEKEMEKRFKKAGTKPEMNRKIAQLKEIEKQVQASREKMDAYESFLKERDELDSTLSEYRQRIKEIDREIVEMKEWNRVYPLLKEKQQLLMNLAELGDVPFPKDGRQRLERLESEKLATEKGLASLTQKQNQLDEEIERIEMDESFIENGQAIEWLIDDLPNYQSLLDQRVKLATEIDQLEDEAKRLASKVNLQCPVEQVEKMDMSLAAKDIITHLARQRDYLKRQREEFMRLDEELLFKVKEKTKRIDGLKNRLLSEKEKRALEKIVEGEKDRELLEREREWILDQMKLSDSSLRRKRNGNRQKIYGIVGLFSLVLLSVITFFYDLGQMAIGFLLSSAILLFFLIFTSKKTEGTDNHDGNLPLKSRLEQIEGKLKHLASNPAEREQAKLRLERDLEIERELEIKRVELHNLETQLEGNTATLEKWERNWREITEKLRKLGESYSLEADMAENHFPDSFDHLEKIKSILMKRNRLQEQKQQLLTQMEKREREMNRLMDMMTVQGSSHQERVLNLKQQLASQRELLRNKIEKITKRDELKEQINSLREESRLIDRRLEQLYKEADSDSKESFLEREDQYKEIIQYRNELQLVEKQLAKVTIPLPEMSEHLPNPYPEQVFLELEEEKRELEREIDRIEGKRAAVNHEISQIEEGGIYSELLQRFHQEKYELAEMAKEWAVYSTARYCLQRSLETYKTEKLPKILKQASEYFRMLTEDKYTKILLNQDRDLLSVVRSDGLVFTPDELSQSTGEQLYISLRFALAITLNKKRNYPLIIDDGFVHFDESRLKRMIALLKELAKDQQILFFTCHRRLTSFFDDRDVIWLTQKV